MNNDLKTIISEVLDYVDRMEIGMRATTNQIVHELGFGNMDMDDLCFVESELMKVVESSRDYKLDKFSHENKLEGLPFDLDFVKMEE